MNAREELSPASNTFPTRSLVDELLACPGADAYRDFLHHSACEFTELDLQSLKRAADGLLRANLDRYLEIGDMFEYIAETANNQAARALSLLVRANACSVGGLGEYARAVEMYDQAAQVYSSLYRPVDEARSQVGRVFALTHLGKDEEAEATAEWAAKVLEEHEEWLPLAKMVSNLGISYSRQGDDLQSLAMFDRARTYALKAGADNNRFLPNVEHNRSVALRDLGRYAESLAASGRARELHLQLGNEVEAARALQSTATTNFALGNYNEALANLELAQQEFIRDGRTRDAMRAELAMASFLVQLRRFGAALEKCDRIRTLFAASGAEYEVAQALLHSAVAYIGLGRHDEAWDALEDARAIYESQGNDAGQATIRLRQSHLLYVKQRYEESASMAAECTEIFTALDRTADAALACVAHARALVALRQVDSADLILQRACEVADKKEIPDLSQQCHHLLGVIAAYRDDTAEALSQFDQAITALELLRGRLMLEFRAGFLEDREAVYADAVQICVRTGEAERALTYVERSKSRALIDLLAGHLTLGLQARHSADQPLVDELVELRRERERLTRRWQQSDENRNAMISAGGSALLDTQAAVLEVERKITEHWHALLIRNADYAQDAALWQPRSEPFQQLLAEDSTLLEYYTVRDKLYLFEVTRNDVHVHALETTASELQRLLEFVQLNMATIPSVRDHSQCAALSMRAQSILHRLYTCLLSPVAGHLTDYERLVFVPHGILHYLPFQALYNGENFLLEHHEISYLPSASFLHYATPGSAERGPLIALGHSNGGRLPNAAAEAVAVAELMGGRSFVDEQATKAELVRAGEEASVLHIAAHGEFRADNPLFSGLLLEDGWLATIDIFDLALRTSLVTLSACQTGRNVIGGGDELLGLTRAFLSSGVSSLVLTHWRVEDASTAQLMHDFYARLASGERKGAALRAAQLAILQEGRENSSGIGGACSYAHPYFWAPFFLVGDTGPLLAGR